jgi:electron transfer flavoprotein alpha subunit
MAKAVVLIEHDLARVKAASLHAITFARQLGGEFSLLILGDGIGELAKSLTAFGAERVLVAEAPALANPVADKYAAVVASVVKSRRADTLIAASSTFTKDILPRIAALLDAGMLTDIIGLEEQDGERLFRRPMYAGNAFGVYRLEGQMRVLSVRASTFDAPEEASDANSPIEPFAVDAAALPAGMEFISREARKSEYPDLTEARVVVSGGRPLKDRETFNQLIGGLAEILGGAVGTTRAAVDAGIAPNDWQIGQTGKIVAPDLYIGVGVSGAIQHLAGIKDARVIVAINRDPDAPIFQMATYGLVGDLYQIVPALIEKLKQTS